MVKWEWNEKEMRGKNSKKMKKWRVRLEEQNQIEL